MNYDYDALNAKRAELEAFAQQVAARHGKDPDGSAHAVVNTFVSITPPEESDAVIELITIYSLTNPRANSRKPGNIVLDWRKLIDIVPDTTIVGASATASELWLLPLIGLYIWNKLLKGADEPLSDVEATIVFALGKTGGSECKIDDDAAFLITNEVRLEHSLIALTRPTFDDGIDRLLRMRCIEIKDGMILLRERISVGYA